MVGPESNYKISVKIGIQNAKQQGIGVENYLDRVG